MPRKEERGRNEAFLGDYTLEMVWKEEAKKNLRQSSNLKSGKKAAHMERSKTMKIPKAFSTPTRSTLLAALSLLAMSPNSFGAPTEGRRDPKKFDPKKHQVVNVVPMLKNKRLSEGLNLIHTLPSGVKIAAKVKGDNIVDWVFTDKNGKTIPSTLYKKRDPERGPKPQGDAHCWRCITSTTDKGTKVEICVAIPCP